MSKIDVSKVNRVELIDHTPCTHCGGKGRLPYANVEGKTECGACGGLKITGRSVVFWDKDKQVELDIKDNGKTLKIHAKEGKLYDKKDK